MSNYDDMRDFQMREQYGDDYITPTFAFTQDDIAQMEHDHGPEYREILDEVMDRDMARYEKQLSARLQSRITYLEEILDNEGIEY